MFLNNHLNLIVFVTLSVFSSSVISGGAMVTENAASGSNKFFMTDEKFTSTLNMAEKGNLDAIVTVANYYAFYKLDNEKHEVWLEKAAEKGDVTSQYNFAMSLISKGNMASTKVANYWLKMASVGDDMAKYELGISYKLGRGFDIDISKACGFFLEAFNGGLEIAKYEIDELNCSSTRVRRNQ